MASDSQTPDWRQRYFFLKRLRMHEDGINYVGLPPQHRCVTGEEFDDAVDAAIQRAGRGDA